MKKKILVESLSIVENNEEMNIYINIKRRLLTDEVLCRVLILIRKRIKYAN